MRIPVSSILGTVRLLEGDPPRVCRDTADARWWARGLSRRLAAREARALRVLDGVGEGVIPQLLGWDGRRLLRSFIAGSELRDLAPTDPGYFRAALRLLRLIHRHGIAHNDLAREANWLVTREGRPAIIDFQLAWHDPARGRLFRLMAREDLRHLLKHKRLYCPATLSRRQHRILASPSPAARIYRWTLLPLGRTLRSRAGGNRPPREE